MQLHKKPSQPNYLGLQPETENSIVMDDNDRVHRSDDIKKHMQKVGRVCLDWAAQSPDLNPMEYVKDVLKLRVKSVQAASPSIRKLKDDIACYMYNE